MFGFLSSLFGSPGPSAAGVDSALIEAAVERTVDGTDRRLRALGDYRKRLSEPVTRAVDHVSALVDALPASAEISRRAFGADTRVRAFFSSAEHLREVLGGLKNLRDYLDSRAGVRPDGIFGLLVMEREERTVLGMELEGDIIRRDVVQVAVNFFHHRYLAPAATEEDTRRELKKRAFDYLIERALERLASERRKRGELERQRRLLRRKLDALRAGSWGLGALFDTRELPPSDIPALEAEIESIDGELGRFGTSALSLEQSLEQIADAMGRPADWLAARRIGLRLDYRGIRLPEVSPAPCLEFELTELFSTSGIRRSVLLGRVPCGEIPERPDFLKQTARYLG